MRKPFLLRIEQDVLESVQRWANDDLRSLNAQIEFLLRRALQDSGRASKARQNDTPLTGDDEGDSDVADHKPEN